MYEALNSRWSNGIVEGYVNRLKMLKRQMYDRAGFVVGNESTGMKVSPGCGRASFALFLAALQRRSCQDFKCDKMHSATIH